MASLHEGHIEIKSARQGWKRTFGVLTNKRLDLYTDHTRNMVFHTVQLSETCKYKETKSKRKDYQFQILTPASDHYFKLEDEKERRIWADSIKTAIKGDDTFGSVHFAPGKSSTLPHTHKISVPSEYGTAYHENRHPHSRYPPPTLPENPYDDPSLTGHGVQFQRPNSPGEDSGIDGSGGSLFVRSRTSSNSTTSPGNSADGIIRHNRYNYGLPRTSTTSGSADGIVRHTPQGVQGAVRNNVSPGSSGDGTVHHPARLGVHHKTSKSAGNSPFVSPGNSGDGHVRRLEQYTWYFSETTRLEIEEILKDENRNVFILRKSEKGGHVLSIKKGDKVSHHKILIKEGTDSYFIHGVEHISDPDLYGLMKKFVDVNKGGHIPYGGSIDSRREDDPENPLYDYVMEEEEIGSMIQKRLKEHHAMVTKDTVDGYVGGRASSRAEANSKSSKPEPPNPSLKPKPQAKAKPKSSFRSELANVIGGKKPKQQKKPPAPLPQNQEIYENVRRNDDVYENVARKHFRS